jgi:hypothetical protein
MLTEHVLEVRYDASGTFLNVCGYVADYIRQANFFPHWKIDLNIVNFSDEPENVKLEGAFVGYGNLWKFGTFMNRLTNSIPFY